MDFREAPGLPGRAKVVVRIGRKLARRVSFMVFQCVLGIGKKVILIVLMLNWGR